MATIAFSAIGNAIAPGVGGFVGALVGSYLDQHLMSMFIDPITGPRITDLKRTGFDEGNPCPYFLGTVRTAGQVIWMSDVRETRELIAGDKKGGPDQIAFRYNCDVAIAFARGVAEYTFPINTLWANGNKLYQTGGATEKTSSRVAVGNSSLSTAQGTGPGNPLYTIRYITYTHDGGGGVSNFFEGYESGTSVTISGFTDAAHNGTFTITHMETDLLGSAGVSQIKVWKCSELTGAGSCVGVTPAAAGDSATFSQVSTEFNEGEFDTITQYNGAATQTPDAVIEAAEGSGNVPAHRGTVYIVVKNLDITKYGANLPSFEALLVEKTPPGTKTVAEAIQDIVEMGGYLTADDIDVSAVTGDIDGMAVTGKRSSVDLLRQIMFVFDLVAQERAVVAADGTFTTKIFFYPKSDADSITAISGDRGAHEAGSQDTQVKQEVTRVGSGGLPREFSLSYLDIERDYQPGLRSHRMKGRVENAVKYDVPIAMDANAAEVVCKRALRELQINEKTKINVNLPPSYYEVAEGDLLVLPDLNPDLNAAADLTIRVDRVDQGALNRMIEVSGLLYSVDVGTQSGVGASEAFAGRELTGSPSLNTRVVDIPPLTDVTAGILTLVTGVSVGDPSGRFPGATLYELFGKVLYTPALSLQTQAVTGVVTTALGDASGNFWDTANEMTIVLDSNNASLESVPDDEVAKGISNWLLIGSEIVGFANATLVSTRTYTLSRLLRGRRDTVANTGTHVANEAALLLTGPGLFQWPVGSKRFGATVRYKGVSIGAVPDDVPDEKIVVVSGESIKQFAPQFLQSYRDGDDIHFTASPRTRYPVRLLSGETKFTLGLSSNDIVAEIMGTGAKVNTVVRTITSSIVDGVASFEYTDTDQVTDFGSVQDPVTVRLYQIGDILNVGRRLEVDI